MAIIPTIKMKRNTAVIIVNESEVAAWEKAGYTVLGRDTEVKAAAPASGNTERAGADSEDKAPAKGGKGKKVAASASGE